LTAESSGMCAEYIKKSRRTPSLEAIDRVRVPHSGFLGVGGEFLAGKIFYLHGQWSQSLSVEDGRKRYGIAGV